MTTRTRIILQGEEWAHVRALVEESDRAIAIACEAIFPTTFAAGLTADERAWFRIGR